MKNILRAAVVGGMAILMVLPIVGSAETDTKRPYPLKGIYLEMTEDFYRALKEQGHSTTQTYSTKMSDEHLCQIAISSRYMVETNLQIMRQQERIIQLLEAIKDKTHSKP